MSDVALGRGRFMLGDCLERMRELPDASVDMILCDLPYGTVKGMRLKGQTDGEHAWDEAIPPAALFGEYERVVRMNGMVLLFAQEPYTSRLVMSGTQNLPFTYLLIWRKNHFANALLANKAPVSYFEDVCVFYKRWDTHNAHPARKYSADLKAHVGRSSKEIEAAIGGGADHFLRSGSSQFSLCTAETYGRLSDVFDLPSWAGFAPYEKLCLMDARSRRVFNLPEGAGHVGNVLDFRKDAGGFHPTQKPVALFEYLIRTYTDEGMTVLDNCAGSGTTAVACERTGRNWVCIERDEGYYWQAVARVMDEVVA